jgi:hypothetical protein
MIAVLVRDEDSSQVFWSARNRSQPFPDLARTEPGINQDAGFVGFEIGAVAIGAAAENRKTDRHGSNHRRSNPKGN